MFGGEQLTSNLARGSSGSDSTAPFGCGFSFSFSANPRVSREILGLLDEPALALCSLLAGCSLIAEAVDLAGCHLGGLVLRPFAHGAFASVGAWWSPSLPPKLNRLKTPHLRRKGL